MTPELRSRCILIALLLLSWAGLVYAKTVLPPSVLADINSLISYIQVLLGGIVGYHVGAPAPVPAAPIPADKEQGGFATVPFLALLSVLALALLSGCASIENAGHASYTVTSVKDGAGKPAFEFAAKDGKEFAERQIQFQTVSGAATLTITEGKSKAFAGQGIAAKALSVLPVTGLTDLISGGAKP